MLNFLESGKNNPEQGFIFCGVAGINFFKTPANVHGVSK